MAINSLPRASLPHRLSRPFSSALLIAACGVWIIESSHVQPVSAVSAPLANVSSVSAGLGFTCVVADGGVKCWGKNDAGQLGNGSTTSSTYPVQVSGLTSGVSFVAAGKDFACAVMLDGTVQCWGSNASGQFGSGDTVSSTVPVDIGISDVTAAAAGTNSTCFIVSGAVQCAGANTNGRLGNNSTVSSSNPVSTGISNATSIAVGGDFACAVSSNAVMCWGANTQGQLGIGNTTQKLIPTAIASLASGVEEVSAGKQHACVRLSTGAVRCWGYNISGQLGDGTNTRSTSPVSLSALASGVTAISARENSTCAVVSGAAQCWGANTWGQVGDGTISARNVPTPVTSLTSGVSNIANGYEHACAVTSTAQVRCWGSQSDGAVGNAVPMYRDVPRAVTGIASGVTALSAGKEHTCAVVSGAAQCWGNNAVGQLGNNVTIPQSSAVQVQGLTTGVTAIAAGEAHSCAVVSGGAQCWGRNDFGQLGNSLNINSSVPVAVTGLGSGVVDISVGSNFSCALLSGGGVRCWGKNDFGQLGDSSNTDSASRVIPSGLLSGVAQLATGNDHACVLLATGGMECWGLNATGQLGDASSSDSNIPVTAFSGLSGITALALGADNTFVIASGAVHCVGSDGNGGVCNGLGTDATSRVAMSSLSTGVTALSAGNFGACAVVAGAAKCWGANDFGQLGSHAVSSNAASPQSVVGLSSGVSKIVSARSTGAYTCALSGAGAVYCWGNNTYGQLGNSESAVVLTPIVVNTAELPSSPTGVNVVAAGRALTVSWTASVSGGAEVVLYNVVGTAGSCSTLGTTSCVLSGLALSTSYSLSITAETVVGVSVAATSNATTTGVPGRPTGVIASSGNSTLDVSWSVPASTGGETLLGYRVYVNGVEGCATLVSDAQPLRCLVGSLSNGTSYAITVKAENVNGLSLASDAASATPDTTTTSTTTSTTSTTLVADTSTSSSSTTYSSTTSSTSTSSSTSTTTTTLAVRIEQSTSSSSSVLEKAITTRTITSGIVAPKSVAVSKAFRVISAADAKRQSIVSATPSVCIAGGLYVVTVDVGSCVVHVKWASGAVARKWNTSVRTVSMASPVYAVGMSVEVLDPIFFRHMSNVPMGYLAPVASAAKSAKNVLVVGHSSLFASEVLSKPSISLRRANAVKQALLAKRVRSHIVVVSVGYGSPVAFALAESAQASNRRVMVYLFS